MMRNGIILVRFDFVNGRDEVIKGGVFYFDKKFVILKVWIFDLELNKDMISSVLVWVKLYGLDVKYWSMMGLSKIGSLIGILMMVDVNKWRKIGINFVRIFIEIDIGKKLIDII